ncbi:MAG TPA: HU family DNA-binding protein [Magnetospirillaceae bacterium]|nr:HU family DNA-binding protein [Magnetospirillaceae bacterium]
METKYFDGLPQAIRRQLISLIEESDLPRDEATRERMAAVWDEKYRLFTGQTALLGMEAADGMEKDDPRGAILLTYSGSLISLGPVRGKSRWLEYASIKLRTDVPELIRGDRANLAGQAKLDAPALFEGCPVRRSSALFRIAVCPPGISADDQERRIREATIFLTNGFVKLNRTRAVGPQSDVDQFTTKAIIGYIARKNGVTQLVTRGLIEDYLSMVETGLLLGERVSVGKLGSASLRHQAARKARLAKHLRTGEEILIPAKPACLAPKFTFSQAVRDKCALVDPTLFEQDTQEDYSVMNPVK